MPVPLPNLDDRCWSDLVDEGRALIPLYAPEWTDHNVHDPGIMLMELFAWIAEMEIYELNRIPDLHKRKFLQLAGVTPRPPLPANAVLALERKSGTGKLLLPATTEFAGADPGGTVTPFRSLHSLSIVSAKLLAIQSQSGGAFEDLTDRWRRTEPVALFGLDPVADSTLFLGFSQELLVGEWVTLYFRFANPRSDTAERERILKEAQAQREACKPPQLDGCRESVGTHQPNRTKPPSLPAHHSVRTTWEFLARRRDTVKWLPLKVDDSTRSFTLNGFVRVRVSAGMAKLATGRVDTPLYYLRCRLAAGSYDSAPMADRIEINAVAAEQSVPAWKEWKIKPDAVVTGTVPRAGDRTSVHFTFDEAGKISALEFLERNSNVPTFRVLYYKPPSPPNEGTLAVEVALLGIGTGAPYQTLPLPQAPADEAGFSLFTLEGVTWKSWRHKPDLTASRSDDLHFLLEPTAGQVSFGNGEDGRVPPPGVLIFAAYNITRAEAGNLASGAIQTILDSAHNRALVGDLGAVQSQLTITNLAAASGGTAEENLPHAIGRAIELREARLRAVTAEDYEFLARETPGVNVARVTARPSMHPSFPCLKAAGLITLLALPFLPDSRPYPSVGLRRVVHSYLQRRRVLGTRVEVVGPNYLEVRVQAQVHGLNGTSKNQLQEKVRNALNEFLHPLRGGPDGLGWPLGRDVYRSEILQVIDQVPGVDHVVSLDLIADGCEPQCGNVCLGPTFLVVAGEHQIEIV